MWNLPGKYVLGSAMEKECLLRTIFSVDRVSDVDLVRRVNFRNQIRMKGVQHLSTYNEASNTFVNMTFVHQLSRVKSNTMKGFSHFQNYAFL